MLRIGTRGLANQDVGSSSAGHSEMRKLAKAWRQLRAYEALEPILTDTKAR